MAGLVMKTCNHVNHVQLVRLPTIIEQPVKHVQLVKGHILVAAVGHVPNLAVTRPILRPDVTPVEMDNIGMYLTVQTVPVGGLNRTPLSGVKVNVSSVQPIPKYH